MYKTDIASTVIKFYSRAHFFLNNDIVVTIITLITVSQFEDGTGEINRGRVSAFSEKKK